MSWKYFLIIPYYAIEQKKKISNALWTGIAELSLGKTLNPKICGPVWMIRIPKSAVYRRNVLICVNVWMGECDLYVKCLDGR